MKKLTLRNYLGYTAGDFANNLAFSLQALFLLIYYTNVVGLDPAAVATMFLLVRAWDAFADLTAGRLVDITRSRWGKFRPYLLFASLPLLLSSVALFSVPQFDSVTAKYVYAYVTYALLGFLYSLTNIPYGSLATAMTQDPIERSRLGIWRSMGPIFGTFILVLVIAPQITRYKTQPDQLQSFLTTVTIVFVVLGYGLYLFCFANCKEQVFHEAKRVTVKETVATIRQNRPLLILCVSNLIFLTGIFAVQASQAYFAVYILGNSSLLIWMVLATSLSTFVAVPIVPGLVARIGKKHTFLIGAAGLVVMGTWIFFMPPSLPVVIGSFFIFGLFQTLSTSLLFAFEADAVEYGEYTTGKRTEGATYAIYSFFRKVSQAVAGAAAGYALALGGFQAKAPQQSDNALLTIRGLVGLGPAIFALLGALIFLAYPLTDTRFREIVKELHARHGIGDEVAGPGGQLGLIADAEPHQET
jgi:glucuronide carrier protein